MDRCQGDRGTCEEALAALQSYLDSELDVVDADRVALHLDACRPCCTEYESFRALKHAVARSDNAVHAEALANLRTLASRLLHDVRGG